MAAVGARTPWIARLKGALQPLGGESLAAVLYSHHRTDLVRARSPERLAGVHELMSLRSRAA